jgi:hypothetical protein
MPQATGGAQRDPRAPVAAPALCRGTREGDFDVQRGASYLYTFPAAEASRLTGERRIVDARIREVETLPPALEAERKALEDRARAAYDLMPRRNRRDPPFTPEQQAEVDRRSAEGRALEDQSRAVVQRHLASVKPELESLKAERARLESFPQTIDLRIEMNARALPPAGAPGAQARTWSTGSPAPQRSAGLQVRNLVVTVGGPPGPARDAVFESIDTGWLQSLVGKAPPEIEASEARAAAVAARPRATVAAVAPTQVTASAATTPSASSAAASPAASPEASPGAPSATSPAPPAVPPAVSPAAPPVATAPPAQAPKCPPTAGPQAGQAASVGATIGGAVFGGGFGRSLGNMIGGAVGTVAQTPPTPGCPN